jgi:glycosyltransferase involved in cell wall biosynthesis
MAESKQRLLIFIVAYNAETTLEAVLRRIPTALAEQFAVEVLVIDDASKDATFERGVAAERTLPFPLHVLTNPVNQGYGGNQKIGFHYAIEQGFDFVALLHGDGQYAPERLPELLQPLCRGEADAVFGSRMLTRGAARDGGMPLYKFVGNKILTWLQNRLLGTRLSEFHSGYRVYAVSALRRIPFDLNANVFHFDSEIIIQLVLARLRIRELPIPTYYGDEICHVNGLRYALDVVIATARARAQQMNLFYDRKYDCAPGSAANHFYRPKLGFPSPHSFARDTVADGARVLDLGCAGGYMGEALKRKNCRVVGVDQFPLEDDVALDGFIQHDLNSGMPPLDLANFDYVLLLDVIEHVAAPEQFVAELKHAARFAPDLKVMVSTGNIAFVLARLSLLLGRFNYGKRGLLDLTHARLFTFGTLRRLFEQAGFEILAVKGAPVPFPLAVGDNALARLLLGVNQLLIRVWPQLFAFQAFLVARPRPSLPYLLDQAHSSSRQRVDSVAAA